jgi:hypothetical protein
MKLELPPKRLRGMGIGRDQLDPVASIVPFMSGSTRSLNAEMKPKLSLLI